MSYKKYIFQLNYIKILKNLKECGVTPYVQSTILAGYKQRSLNNSIARLNEKLHKYSNENNIVFVDLNSVLSSKGFLDTAFTVDDVHLNGEGYKAWKNILKNYVY